MHRDTIPSIGDVDYHLFNEGRHARLYEKLGAHPGRFDGVDGTFFAVWAPNAARVGIIGDWSHWREVHALEKHHPSGVWQGFFPGVAGGHQYKYRVEAADSGYWVEKSDPFAVFRERPPATASIVWPLDYTWGDTKWMESRRARNGLHAPMCVYELHLGSWQRVPEEGNRFLTYREIGPRLVEHMHRTGFTHVELMPVMEYPYDPSWGYQVTGYFAPTSRFGTPQDFMALIDLLHQNDIGVILDWVPAHFPTDEHGLIYFDGTHLYEHADPRQGLHAEWGSAIFNYGRREVQSFLISNATYWLDVFHCDGLRVDAVASMLYLDYGRKHGEWVANQWGGHENIEAIDFMRACNEAIYREHPDVQTIAEESTSWPMVSRPTYVGGLGFGLKWDMGFMHDTLGYLAKDPVYRRHHHNQLTFRGMYAFSENFVLPLSHDEVVHGKGSLINKMAGDTWQKFANLRLLYAYMWSQPGKKLLFMGGEFAQWREWKFDASLDWHLLREMPLHGQVQLLIGELNRLYRNEAALHELDCDPAGYEWIDANDADGSVLSYLRKSRAGENGRTESVVCLLNFTPLPRFNYRVGVDAEGFYREILNTDAEAFGGSGHSNAGGVMASPVPAHGRRFSLNLTLPPLGAIFLKTAPATRAAATFSAW